MITHKAFAAHCTALADILPPECVFFLAVMEVFPEGEDGRTKVDIAVAGSSIDDPVKAAVATALRQLADQIAAGEQASGEPE